MSSAPDSITGDGILSLLQRENIVPRGKEVKFQSYPPNPSRNDGRRRMSFRIQAGEDAALHVTTGSNLDDLHQRAQAFARDNPEIACRPLFFSRHDGLDLFGQEYFGVNNLEDGLARGQIDESGWRDGVVYVKGRLSATSRPSSADRLLGELADMEKGLLAAACFTRFDHTFLREAIFPVVRNGAASLPLETAWTNGDFTAKNILFDGRGHYRLIDCEFAQRTHFSQIDWFRLHCFSDIPSGIDFPALSGVKAGHGWMEILCWLQHALRLSEVCVPSLAEYDLQLIAGRLSVLLGSATGVEKRSIFLNAIEQETGLPAPSRGDPASPGTRLRRSAARLPVPIAQLFLPISGGEPRYADKQSLRAPVPVVDAWTDVAFDLPALPAGSVLRYDPCEQPGYLEISRIEIRIPASGTDPEFTAELIGPQTDGSAPVAEGDCLALTDAAPFCFILFGSDPILKLPPLPAKLAGRAGRLLAKLRLSSQAPPAAWAKALQMERELATRSTNDGSNQPAALAASETRHNELLTSLYAQNEAILDYEAQSHELRQAKARAEAELARLRRRPLVRLDSALRGKKGKAEP